MTTVSNCFRRAKFVPQKESEDTFDKDPDDNIQLARLLFNKVCLADYATINDQVTTSAPATDDSIIAEIISGRTSCKNNVDDDDDDVEIQEQPTTTPQPPSLTIAYSALDTLHALVEML